MEDDACFSQELRSAKIATFLKERKTKGRGFEGVLMIPLLNLNGEGENHILHRLY